jgi:hypothetical protein
VRRLGGHENKRSPSGVNVMSTIQGNFDPLPAQKMAIFSKTNVVIILLR